MVRIVFSLPVRGSTHFLTNCHISMGEAIQGWSKTLPLFADPDWI